MTTAPRNPPTESTARPIPPRYWWTRRLAAAFGVLVLLLVGVRVWWGYVAETRLQARLAELHAQGEPVAVTDFAAPPLADEDNAAVFLIKAAAAVPDPPNLQLNRWSLDRRACAENLTALQSLLAANATVFDLVRVARDIPAADWGVRPTSPAINLLFPFLAPQRKLAKFLVVAAQVHHLSGDDTAAVEDVHDALRLGERMDAVQFPCLINHLVAIAISALAVQRIEDIVPQLWVAPAAFPAPANVTPAPRAAVQSVIATLLDERSSVDAWRRAMQGERVFQVDTVQCIASGAFSGSGSPAIAGGPGSSATFGTMGWLLSPAWKLDVLRMIDFNSQILSASTAATWPAVRARWPRLDDTGGPIRSISRMAANILMPSLDRALLLHFRELADRRMAAIALSMRLYELDHGHRPTQLADLVPDYLAQLPGDPFDPGGGPLRYAPNAPSPVLYSVGQDGIDDEGAFVLSGPGAIDQELKDRPFFLNGDRPFPPPPATNPSPPSQPASMQAVPDNQQKIDPERQQQAGEGDSERRGGQE